MFRTQELMLKQNRLLQGIAVAASKLLTSSDHVRGIREALAVIGAVTEVQRVYIIESQVDDLQEELVSAILLDWLEPAFSARLAAGEGRLAYPLKLLNRRYGELCSGTPVIEPVQNLSIATGEMDCLSSAGTVLFLPIIVNDCFRGVIGLDDFMHERIWSAYDLAVLSIAASCIGGALERMQQQKKLEMTNQILHRLSTQDGLTEVANRRYFDEFYQREWRRAIRNSSPLSLIMLDIDYFKSFNDAYGHQGGDACLKQISNIMKRTVNRSTDLVARYGGEEFSIVLPETDLAGASFVAEQLRTNVEVTEISNTQSQVSKYVTVSIGVATAYPRMDLPPETLLQTADHALYQAKIAGRNQVKSLHIP